MKHKLLVITVGLCALLSASSASAQISRLGETFRLWAATVRGSDLAYDSRNDVYLVVSGHGAIIGRFVSADGGLLGEPFILQAAAGFGQFPHVAYSPDANNGSGAFLVTWHESDAAVPSIHARLISYPSGFVGPDHRIVGNDTYWEIMGAPIVYSAASREFFVVWRQYADTNIFGLRLNLAGDAVGGVVPVATTTLFESDPSVVFNSAANEYFVVYRRGFGAVSVMGQRIKAGTGDLVGGPSILGQAATVNTTGVTYNPNTNQYLAAWHQIPPDAIMGRVVGADGQPLGNVVPLSSRYGTYDSLSVDANVVSGTALLVGHDKLSVEDGGVEITSGGAPMSGGMQVSAAGGTGNFYPRTRAHGTRQEWLVVAANQFARLIGQRVVTTARDPGTGGPGPTPTPPPPAPPAPATPNPKMFLDVPGNNSTVQTTFAVGGWAADLGAPSGTGVSTVHVWAAPTNGAAAIFLGAANMGVTRPDIAAYFNNGALAAAGFGLSATLPPGTYDITAYAFSVVSGSFNNAHRVRVTVVAPVPIPRMFVDGPSQNQTVAQVFPIGGWAVDLGASSGCGVGAIHVWAYPIAGGNPIFVGATTPQYNRSDVAAYFGAPRVMTSGYFLQGTLPPGEYNLVVFAWSTVTASFNNAAVIRIRVV